MLLLLAGCAGAGAPSPEPSLVSELERARRTMIDMREIGRVLESVGEEGGAVPTVSSIAEVRAASGRDDLPVEDRWGTPFVVRSGPPGYRIVSWGRDRRPGPEDGGASGRLDEDIVFADGRFVAWPSDAVR